MLTVGARRGKFGARHASSSCCCAGRPGVRRQHEETPASFPVRDVPSTWPGKRQPACEHSIHAVPSHDYGLAMYNRLATSLKRPDIISLPWRLGLDSQMGKESAERLDVLSDNLRRYLRESVPRGDTRPDVDKLRNLITEGKSGKGSRGDKTSLEWNSPAAIPTLVQMLQGENTPVRVLLVELLEKIPGKEAGATIAQRAIFDLSPAARERAIAALAKRPKAEFQQVLVDGLRYPWPAAAEHAETLMSLQLADAAPAMIALLKDPDPRLPFAVPGAKQGTHAMRELVRINHMSNCMLCHAPSAGKADLVRG